MVIKYWDRFCNTSVLIWLLLYISFTPPQVNSISHPPKQHLSLGEVCGENRSCSSNQGLHCSQETNACECPDGASFLQSNPEDQPKCRVKPGEQCSITNTTAPLCFENYRCKPEKQNSNQTMEEVKTICKCAVNQEDCGDAIEVRRALGLIQKPNLIIISFSSTLGLFGLEYFLLRT